MNNELESLSLENKVRALVSELLSPLLSQYSDHENLLKKLSKRSLSTKHKLASFEDEIQKSLSRNISIFDFNSKIESMDKKASSDLNTLNFELRSCKSALDSHSVLLSDIKTQLKFFEQKNKSLLESVESNYKHICEFRDTIAVESSRSILTAKSFIDSQNDYNISLSERINKLSNSLAEINNKGLPSVLTLIEKRNFEIEEIKSSVEVLRNERVVPDDLNKLKNKWESEICRLNDKCLKDSEEIRTFLHQMVGLEISCGVSDTLLKILDTQHIKKLIPVVETQLRAPALTTQHNSLTIKAVTTDKLFSKVLTQTKKLENNLASCKERISKEEEEERERLRIKDAKKRKPGLGHLEKSSKNTKTFQNKLKNMSKAEFSEIRTEQLLVENQELGFNSDDSDYQSQLDFVFKELQSQKSFQIEIAKRQNDITKLFSSLQASIDQSQKEFRTSNTILSDEFHHLLKLKGKEAFELTAKCESLTKTTNSLEQSLESLQTAQSSSQISINNLIESTKIIYSLIRQDEDDRKSLQLTGFSTQSKSKSPTKNRPTVTLKPECVSCSDQSAFLLSSFKMACLNYAPSDLEYSGKVYSRPGLISKLARVISHSESCEVPEESIKTVLVTEPAQRAKSASKIRYGRHVFDASLSRGLFSETPSKRSEPKIAKFTF